MESVVKSIVLNTALICAKRSSSFLETTTIQSFSRIILDPTEATWAISAKIMVIIGASVGNQVGQDDSPTLEIKMEIQNIIYKNFLKF